MNQRAQMKQIKDLIESNQEAIKEYDDRVREMLRAPYYQHDDGISILTDKVYDAKTKEQVEELGAWLDKCIGWASDVVKDIKNLESAPDHITKPIAKLVSYMIVEQLNRLKAATSVKLDRLQCEVNIKDLEEHAEKIQNSAAIKAD